MDQRPVLVIGDSHSLFFRGHDTISAAPFSHPGIDILHLSVASAWRLSTPGDKFQWLMQKAFHSERYAAIIISAGYIDCRSHVVRCAAINNGSAEQQAFELADRLIASVSEAQLYGRAKAVFLGPPASAAMSHHIGWMIEGSQQERNRATVAYSDRLKSNRSFGFVDTLDFTLRSDGTTISKAFYDATHMRADYLPTVIDRVRGELRRIGGEWAETGGGDFKLACHPKEIRRAQAKHRAEAITAYT